MNRTAFIRRLPTALTLLAVLGNLPSATADAASHTYGVSQKKAAVVIGQAEVTLEEVAAADYKVPILIKMQPNPGITTMEFGFETELTYEVLHSDDLDPETERGAAIRTLPTAPKGMNLLIDLISSSSEHDGLHMTWFVLCSEKERTTVNIAAVLVDVPKTAQEGDTFVLHYRDYSYEPDSIGRPSYCESSTDAGLKDYYAEGAFEGLDGYIHIIKPLAATTAVTTESPTETTAVTEKTTQPIEPAPLLGDVNLDGRVNADDAAEILKDAAYAGTGKSRLTAEIFALADVNATAEQTQMTQRPCFSTVRMWEPATAEPCGSIFPVRMQGKNSEKISLSPLLFLSICGMI